MADLPFCPLCKDKCKAWYCMFWENQHNACVINHSMAAAAYLLEQLNERFESLLMILAKES